MKDVIREHSTCIFANYVVKISVMNAITNIKHIHRKPMLAINLIVITFIKFIMMILMRFRA